MVKRTKIAMISDVHSNLFYLEETLKDIEREGVSQIYCLGDLVGYYEEPNEVIDLIRKKGIICIKGNHEKYLLGELSYNIKNEKLYRIEKQRKMITENNLEFLKGLPDELFLEVNNCKVYMTHSLPGDSENYLFNPELLDLNFLKNYDYYFYGHTHIPLVVYRYGTCIVNPGSVGQPRDYTKLPSYAVIDFSLKEVKIRKVNIDIHRFIKKLKYKGYPIQLIKILEREKE